MQKKIKRAVYRKNGDIFYKYLPNMTVISVVYQTLFAIAEIKIERYTEVSKNHTVCKKKLFIKNYRKARKEIRL